MSTSFKSFERTAWTEKAANYDSLFADITAQAVPPILSAAGDLAGKDVLDVCCGTGDLAIALGEGGATVSAVDFVLPMAAIARDKASDAAVSVGDAESLAFADASFDVVTCAFGLWHMTDPAKALAEARRVLKPGGLYIYTAWGPAEGFDVMNIVNAAIKSHGTMDIELPPSPPPFQFSEEASALPLLTEAGFRNGALTHHIAAKTHRSGQEVIDILYRAIVRTPMLIDRQAASVRKLVLESIAQRAEARRVNGVFRLEWPFALGVATAA
ncbi:methyltransferase domain-containing protein [Acuticoccus sp. M5D2P5]|uniref:class I SAM-dependent methyltransferase n=1 Tax=Acuticoccus kalidii TaxID=2910977 RepID=UPI001F36F1FF|nr:methyltransferase domain-containing protein [Acuticoccus kalidii]MCF3934194.1 methyltransferase domain-containing protein [Acuticoccus kalidii]